jgi:hypothetical protein
MSKNVTVRPDCVERRAVHVASRILEDFPMPTAAVKPASPEKLWLTGREAARRLKASPYLLMKMGHLGKVRILLEPGTSPRYSAEDVDKLMSERRSK